MDLIVRNAKLREKRILVDLAIKDGRFRSIKENITLEADREIDAKGNLVLPAFVESHVHLDSALTAGNPRFNKSGTLLEGIGLWSEYKKTFSKEDIKSKARETVQWLLANGVLKVRAHTDCSLPSLVTIEAMLELREELKDYVDLQVVAFPQDGIFAYEGMEDLLIRAVEMGVDVIGGMPQAELTREDGIRSIDFIFNLAEKHNLLIDIHTDETGDDHSRFLEVIAKYTIERKMAGKVTASHTTAMHNYDNDYAAKIISNVKRAGVNIVTNPFSNSLLQNRTDGYPRRRGHTRIDELIRAGVNLSIGNDNIMDPFNPLGKGSLLQAAHLLVHTAHLSSEEDMNLLFDMITYNGAKTLDELANYGIDENKQADFIILDARDEKEALRLTADCLYVIRKGEVLLQTEPAKRELFMDGSELVVDFK